MTSRWAATFTSGAFKFALMVAAIFAIGSLGLLLVVDRSMKHYAEEATRGSLIAETNGMTEIDRSAGRPAFLRALDTRQAGRDPQFNYAVLDPSGRLIEGNLIVQLRRPGVSRAQTAPDIAAGETDTMPALVTKLRDNSLLVVATDNYDVDDLRHRLDRITFGGGFIVTMLALLGGYFVGGRFLSRLDRVNHAVARIIDGELDERLPAIGMSREFDALSRNLNVMLDRIGVLIDTMRQVSTDIAHDLRTPLTRLRQHLETAEASAPSSVTAVAVAAALRQTDEMLHIFRALLRIGTLEGGAGRTRFSRVDLSDVMLRVFHVYQPVADDGGRHLTAQIKPGIAVTGDAELLTQLFTNLIENALTHTPRGSNLRITLDSCDATPIAKVSDDGPGIPLAERANVLRRFYRLDASRGSPGVGLGLALAAAITTLHRADLTLNSADPGLIVEVRFEGGRYRAVGNRIRSADD